MNISNFYNSEYKSYANYDNYRKITSLVDGCKASARKCLYIFLKDKIKESTKVADLKSLVSQKTAYLHGDDSLGGVIVSMAQNFAGTNNIPFFKRNGTFGNRLFTENAAFRYIFSCQEDYLGNIYKEEDNSNLIEQIFEGKKIEPKFFVPVIPMILCNNSNGITQGFKQLILSRNPLELIDWIKCKLNKKEFNGELKPWFNGFTGTVTKQADNSWIITGSYQRINFNTIHITDIPIGYDLESYLKVLDKLVETKKIKDYNDLSDNGKFLFEVIFYRNQGLNIDKCNIINELKLSKQVSEIYVCENENNAIVKYNDIFEILDAYYNIRYDYYNKRKATLIKQISEKIAIDTSRYQFIHNVIDGNIVLAKRTEENVINQLNKFNDIIPDSNGSYDYLLNMPCSSMTKEKLERLKNVLDQGKQELNVIKASSIEEMWLNDLKIIESDLKKIKLK